MMMKWRLMQSREVNYLIRMFADGDVSNIIIEPMNIVMCI